MIILITGFMGAGKTTLLGQLEKFYRQGSVKSSCTFMDLDQAIVSRTEHSIPQLFALGEAHFRAQEEATLREVVQKFSRQKKNHLFLALGGGTLHEGTLTWLEPILKKGDIFLLWVQAPVELCWERAQLTERPLVGQGVDFFFNLYRQRLAFYQKAQLHISSLSPYSDDTLLELFTQARLS